jgi:PucR family transcriptional regulator, purine catabolism regulatory protein
MPLTLREAMKTIEPLSRSHIVAGETGIDKNIQFVNVMEVPDILEWVRPGELLVTTLYPLRDNIAAIEGLIPKLSERGLVGLAVTMGYIKNFRLV